MQKGCYTVIGVMSGTSLDGLDLAYCSFKFDNGKWTYEIREAETHPYSEEWRSLLANAGSVSGEQLARLHKSYGTYIGKMVKKMIDRHSIKPAMIASHGHTVFHDPGNGLTLQIGDGWSIFAETLTPVINDFRSLDVALGGQGAPLVPIGDRLLFGEYRYCLNLGGIANISFEKNDQRIAFDICPANMLLNYLAEKTGLTYDENGRTASKGIVNENLLLTLDNLSFYHNPPPKSLGREWFEMTVTPLFNRQKISIDDMMRTSVEHIVNQLVKVLDDDGNIGKLLITGGGAHNEFLINSIREKVSVEVVVPKKLLIDFKEAMIFAFLAVLKVRNELNTLGSVTGAKRDSVGGVIISEA